MTTQDKIAIVSALIAAAGILVTILIYRLKRKHLKRDQVIVAFRSLLQKLEHTHFFDVDPEQEIWEFGFDSIKELASLCAPAAVAANSNFVPKNVRASVLQLNAQVKGIRALHDSWRLFRNGKGDDWRSIQRTWPDIERAKAVLQVAQPVAAQCKRELSSFLGKA